VAQDEHSHAEPNRVRVSHVSLDLELDFEARSARGSCRLLLARIDPAAPLMLDSKGLVIQAVEGDDGTPRTYDLGAEHDNLGAPLRIELAPKDEAIVVRYQTPPGAEAMQWLAPEQTAHGARSFLFTQGQAVFTRTWIPLQDSPGVRVTYDARIQAPQGYTAVMSAERGERGKDGSFDFRMPHPIPPYLIALACGELRFRPISDRCGVWAEPNVVAGARDELADTEAMIRAAESLFGPYRWGRYDILILPPSFPYGGMENPRLTFATPTILAGDKSLVALVAHELAHSWSGNLVTNATWRDFWLNEGFTVYLEQRIMEEVFGLERSSMEQVLSRAELEEELKGMKPQDTVLHIDLSGRHPDDGFSQVPYEKGALFLRRLEQGYGREAFDAFLTKYFDRHAFRSITTPEFESYLVKHLIADQTARGPQVDLDAWLRQPGLPPDAPRQRSSLLDKVDAELEAFEFGKAAGKLAARGWVTQQWLRFLNGLPKDLSVARMAELDQAFDFTHSGNSEIVCAWLQRAIATGYGAADARLEEFLMNVGRRKFLKPIYTALIQTPAGKDRARSIYALARPRYHAVSRGTLDKLLEWQPQDTPAQ
jgi:aminopeptidase N